MTGEQRGGMVDVERRTQPSSTKGRHTAARAGRSRVIVPVVAVVALVAAACSSSPASTSTTSSSPTTSATSSNPATGAPSPGVTNTTVTVGQVDDLTKPLPGLFKGAEDGTQAYFDYINSLGGVNGRKIKLDAQDSGYDPGIVANATAAQVKNDFALVGGFSLLDSSEEPLVAQSKIPFVAFPLDPDLSNLPTAFSPLPNPANDYPLVVFKTLKKKFPQAIKKVGILWANATASTASSEAAFERAARSQGFNIIYDSSFTPSQTTFLPNVLTMKAKGVQMFFTTQMPDAYAATVAKEMQQQNFSPVVVQGDAYSSSLVNEGGPAVNGMYIEIAYVLYLGADQSLPAVKLFDKWMTTADSNANFQLQALYAWASAALFVQALKQAGNPPTRAGLIGALDKITNFDAGGLTGPSNPAGNVPTPCGLLAQVQNGKIVRVSPTPSTGFICDPGSYLPAAGFKPEVRPAPSS